MKTSKPREDEEPSVTECSMGIIEDRRADRERMVATQIEARGIHDPLVLDAMRSVPGRRLCRPPGRPMRIGMLRFPSARVRQCLHPTSRP
jgi:hypothetical protein